VKVIIFGATGMVGQGVLREALLAKDVESVVSVGRRPTGVRHAKLHEVTLTDFTDLSPIVDDLAGADACFYCLGVSSVGKDEAEYTRIAYEFPLAAARTLKGLDPELTFVYVSGAGTSASGRQMWQRVKARAEAEIIDLLPNGYAFRPGLIIPTHGAGPRSRFFRGAFAVAGPLLRVFDRMAPKYSTSSDKLGRAMLRAARGGFHTHIIQHEDLR
jgi:uncharacterized protein YbjT (DUF2867 family)